VIDIVEYTNERIALKKRPTIFLKAEGRIVKFKANYLSQDFNKFNQAF